LLSSLEHLGVKLEFLSFQNVTIATATLSWSGRDAGQKTTRSKFVVQSRVKGAGLLSISQLANKTVGSLDGILSGLLGLLDTNLDTVVLFVPGTEWRGIDLNNRVLDKSLGSHQLVIGGVVNNVKDTSLSGGDFRSPTEVSGIQAEGSVLQISTSDADNVDALRADFGVGSGSARFIKSLLLQVGLSATCMSSLMSTITRFFFDRPVPDLMF